MGKFSVKEKVALAIFVLIPLGIIIQMLARVDVLEPLFAVVPSKLAEVDLSSNLLNRPGVSLTVSSIHNTSTEDRLIDRNPRSFWHVALDQVGEPAWVTIDLSKGKEKIVQSLAALPRDDLPWQFLRTAKLLGSRNGEEWEPIAAIVLWQRPARKDGLPDWWRWDFENDRAFRFYKLLITDGHEGGRFFSLAELALFE